MSFNTDTIYTVGPDSRDKSGATTFDTGDRIRVTRAEPDSDGDMFAYVVDSYGVRIDYDQPGNKRGYVLPQFVVLPHETPSLEEIRSALVALGIEDSVLTVTRAIADVKAKVSA